MAGNFLSEKCDLKLSLHSRERSLLYATLVASWMRYVMTHCSFAPKSGTKETTENLRQLGVVVEDVKFCPKCLTPTRQKVEILGTSPRPLLTRGKLKSATSFASDQKKERESVRVAGMIPYSGMVQANLSLALLLVQ